MYSLVSGADVGRIPGESPENVFLPTHCRCLTSSRESTCESQQSHKLSQAGHQISQQSHNALRPLNAVPRGMTLRLTCVRLEATAMTHCVSSARCAPLHNVVPRAVMWYYAALRTATLLVLCCAALRSALQCCAAVCCELRGMLRCVLRCVLCFVAL